MLKHDVVSGTVEEKEEVETRKEKEVQGDHQDGWSSTQWHQRGQ